MSSIVLSEESLTWLPLIIFVLKAIDLTLATVRVICVTREHQYVALVLGFIEQIITVFCMGAVLIHLDQWLNIVAYAGGFAVGNVIGVYVERHLALGTQTIHMVTDSATSIASELQPEHSMVTVLTGQGRDGPVSICSATVRRRQARRVIHLAKQIDPRVTITVEDIRDSLVAA